MECPCPLSDSQIVETATRAFQLGHDSHTSQRGTCSSPAATRITPFTTAESVQRSPSAEDCSSDLRLSLASPRPAQEDQKHQHSKARSMPPGTMLQLVQQQSKFLDVLQHMIDTSLGHTAQHHQTDHAGGSISVSTTGGPHDAAAATDTDAAAAAASTAPVQQQALDVAGQQDSKQPSNNHTLKKRCLKVQKAMLRQVQAAHARAQMAQMAADEAHRQRQQVVADNAALRAQLVKQQQVVEAQQQQLQDLQAQLQQFKDLHKQKLSKLKEQLQQQYEAQLQVAAAAYTQELSLAQAVLDSAQELASSSCGGGLGSSSGQNLRRPKPLVTSKAKHSPAKGAVPKAASQQAQRPWSPPGVATAAAAIGSSKMLSAVRFASPQRAGTRASSPAVSRSGRVVGSDSSGRVKPMSLPSPQKARPHSAAAHTGATPTGAVATAPAAGDASAQRVAIAASLCQQAPPSGVVRQLLQQLSVNGGSSGSKLEGAAIELQVQQAAGEGQQQQAQQQAQQPKRKKLKAAANAQPRASTQVAAAAAAAALAAAAEAKDSSVAALSGAAATSKEAVEPSARRETVAVSQQLRSHHLLLLAQLLAEHPELADMEPVQQVPVSLQQPVAADAEQHLEPEQHQQQRRAQQPKPGSSNVAEVVLQHQGGPETTQLLPASPCGPHQQDGTDGGRDVPAAVLEQARQYQQGGEGRCRPTSATPSVLQLQPQVQVPQAAVQLTQHFVSGGEGTSRPLTAPSSDRTRAMVSQQPQRQRAGSPTAHGSRQASAGIEGRAQGGAVVLDQEPCLAL